ncbi:MAG: DUF2480 family protein [Bacteroidetes bacterium]|nr:DUF2480 family protein [Bacteroidota bacterium]
MPIKIDINDYLENGIIKEESFRKKIEKTNWNVYEGEKVYLQGCDKIPIPTWAYLILVSKLIPTASRIYWGDPCSAILIHKRLN